MHYLQPCSIEGLKNTKFVLRSRFIRNDRDKIATRKVINKIKYPIFIAIVSKGFPISFMTSWLYLAVGKDEKKNKTVNWFFWKRNWVVKSRSAWGKLGLMRSNVRLCWNTSSCSKSTIKEDKVRKVHVTCIGKSCSRGRRHVQSFESNEEVIAQKEAYFADHQKTYCTNELKKLFKNKAIFRDKSQFF